MGTWLGTLEIFPVVILCSDAQRTRETLDLILENSGWDEGQIEIRILPELYLASSSTIQDLIQDALSDHDAVLVVGHNPGMDFTLLELFPNSRELADDKLMTTAAVAILEASDESLSDISLNAFRCSRDL